MTQLFLHVLQRHAEGFRYQLEHFRGSTAPTLPGHLAGGLPKCRALYGLGAGMAVGPGLSA